MGYKVNPSLENVHGFVNLFSSYGGVHTLKMAPTRLLILHMVDVVEPDYVVVSKFVLEGYDYGCLDYFWEVTSN